MPLEGGRGERESSTTAVRYCGRIKEREINDATFGPARSPTRSEGENLLSVGKASILSPFFFFFSAAVSPWFLRPPPPSQKWTLSCICMLMRRRERGGREEPEDGRVLEGGGFSALIAIYYTKYAERRLKQTSLIFPFFFRL